MQIHQKIRGKSYNKWKKKALERKRKILFIAESPPLNPENYFYFNDRPYSKNSLSHYLFSALGINQNLKDKNIGLNEFIKQGYFLVDAISFPRFKNKKLFNKKKQLNDEKNKNFLYKEIRSLNPKNIVIIGCGVYDAISNQIERQKLVNIRINFPSRGHQSQFKKDIKKALKALGKNF